MSSDEKRPFISVVVIVYRMHAQAKNTLFSLSAAYQQNVNEEEYEVLVVENPSDDILGKEAVLQLGSNFRYYLRDENHVSPVYAVNFGVQEAQGPIVCLMIDGARMVTPGVIRYMQDAYRITPNAFVAVPGYHLGDELQQEAVKAGYNEEVEAEMLRKIDWPQDGYRLFEVACFSATSVMGFFGNLAESNCFSLPKRTYEEIGGCDPRFDLPGGGFINLDLYKRLCELPSLTLFMLFGEGTFHQLHEGVSTGKRSKISTKMLQYKFRKQYRKIRGEDWELPRTKAVMLGEVHGSVKRFIELSLNYL